MNLSEISKKTAITMKRRKLKYILCACVFWYLYYFIGVTDYVLSQSYDNNFDYPLNININDVVDDILVGKKTSVTPINYYPYRFLTNSGKCSTIEKLDLFIAVKSSMGNFRHRNAVRETYGQENIPGRIVKTLFFLGIDDKPKSKVQEQIDKEMAEHKDIIQMDFIDAYYNSTVKTMMAFRWMYEHCSSADFYLITDDDMYISVNNLLDYVHDKTEQRRSNVVSKKEEDEFMPQTTELQKEEHLLSGYVFESAPQRFRHSKWRVSLDEYRWDRWPPYVTGMATVVSNKTMKVLYVASLFVKHFRFDDIFLGIVAKKVGIVPTHSPNFYFYKKKYNKEDYRDVIASHGYGNHDELVRIWNEQNNVT